MKILHIVVLPEFAGAQTIAYQVLKALPSGDYDRTIMFSSEGTDTAKAFVTKEFEKIGVQVVFSKYLVREISIKKDFNAVKEIFRFCKTEHFDVVHTHSSKPGIVGDIAARLARVPLVIHTVHGLAFHAFVPFPKWQIYFLCEMFASLFRKKIVLVNAFYKRYFRLFGKKTCTIYNGMDFSRFSDFPKETKMDDVIEVLFVGRFDTPKKILCLLQAAKIVVEKNKRVHFTLVGSGEDFYAAKQFVEENKLTEKVLLTGWQKNPAAYYAKADIFAASSIYEAFGLMFIEAGYYGVPVCATDVEGIPEVVIHGKSGLLCPPNDAAALAENILCLCENKSLRLRLGKENHYRSTELFTITRMVESYKKLYEESRNK